MSTTNASPTSNAVGRYSIMEESDGCGICASFSSYTFEATEDGGRYFIARQPEPGSDEEGIVRDAMAACPLECIRDDANSTPFAEPVSDDAPALRVGGER